MDRRPIHLSDLQDQQRKERGLVCDRCGCRDLRVYYTDSRSKFKIIRYRKCRHCGALYVSEERIRKKNYK